MAQTGAVFAVLALLVVATFAGRLDVTDIAVNGAEQTFVGSQTFSVKPTVAVGSLQITIQRVNGTEAINSNVQRCSVPGTTTACDINGRVTECTLDVSSCLLTQGADYFFPVETADNIAYNVSVVQTEITPTVLSGAVAGQVDADSSDYYSFTITDVTRVYTITLTRNTNATAAITLLSSTTNVAATGCSTNQCPTSVTNPTCRFQYTPACGLTAGTYYFTVQTTSADAQSYNLSVSAVTPTAAVVSLTQGTTLSCEHDESCYARVTLDSNAATTLSTARFTVATANYDGTIEIAVNTKPWPTTTCITDPVCTLNVGAGSAPTQNPDCDFILERCEGSDFYFAIRSVTQRGTSVGSSLNISIEIQQQSFNATTLVFDSVYNQTGTETAYYKLPALGGHSGQRVVATLTGFNHVGFTATAFVSRGGITGGQCGTNLFTGTCQQPVAGGGVDTCVFSLPLCRFESESGDLYLSLEGSGSFFNFTIMLVDAISLNSRSEVNGTAYPNSVVTYSLPAVAAGKVLEATLDFTNQFANLALSTFSPAEVGCLPSVASCQAIAGAACTAPLRCLGSGETGLRVARSGGISNRPTDYTLTITEIDELLLPLNLTTTLNVTSRYYRLDVATAQALRMDITTSTSPITATLLRNCVPVSSIGCNTGQENCQFRIESSLEAETGAYFLHLEKTNLTPNTEVTVVTTVGIDTCLNIAGNSTELDLCKGVVATGLYAVHNVSEADKAARENYENFYRVYQGACNDTLVAFACSLHFPPCATSTGLFTPKCKQECLGALAQCDAEVCVTELCDAAVDCPPPPPTPQPPPATPTGASPTSATPISAPGPNSPVGSASSISMAAAAAVMVCAVLF